MTSNKDSIAFYDIILDPAAYPSSPNPWKTRYALNFAKVPYNTTWVPLQDVTKARNALNLPANRKHANGTDFPTLPIIRDPLASPEKGEVLLGDTFDIALHLNDTYLSSNPEQGQLFPPKTVALHRSFNAQVDQIFTEYGAPLAGFYMPFDPRTAESDKAAFMSRIPGSMKWDDIEMPQGSDVRNKMLKGFEDALDTKLGHCFSGAGPFMDGSDRPIYADFIVGGWLQFMRVCLPEWKDLRDKWSGGKWGRLSNALDEWASVDGREGVVPPR